MVRFSRKVVPVIRVVPHVVLSQALQVVHIQAEHVPDAVWHEGRERSCRHRLPTRSNNGADMFDYDWFHGPAFGQQKEEARWRCALQHFPNLDPKQAREDQEFTKFHSGLEERTLIYLRDGFSYEVRQIASVSSGRFSV